MLIIGKRIHSNKYFNNLTINEDFRIKVNVTNDRNNLLVAFGFKDCDVSNTKILPAHFNRYAKRNCEKYYTINKYLPKEEYTQTVYWTRTEWAGYKETREVTEFTDFTRKRYHRDYYLPFSVEFTL